jgi:hypothetical protein
VTGPAGPNEVNASDFRIVAPTGKVLQFDISAISDNTTRTLSAPNLDGTYVTTTGVQVIKDKTFTPSAVTDPAATFKALNSQTAPLLMLRDSNNIEISRISADSLDNTWFGKSAGLALTSGQSNSGFGSETLKALTSGGFNTAVGRKALTKNTTGSNSVAVGYQALAALTTASNNTAIGYQALSQVITGQFNTGVGYQVSLSDGKDYSTLFGVSSLVDASYAAAIGPNTEVSADHGVAIGSAAKVLSNGLNSVAIGKDTQIDSPDVIQLGTNSTTVQVYNAISVLSDIRDKADVRDTVLGLEFIEALRPVDYRMDVRDSYRTAEPARPAPDASAADKAAWKTAHDAWAEANRLGNLHADGTRKGERFHHGFVAQEVEGLIAASGIDFGGYQDASVNGGEDRKQLAYTEFIAPVIRAVQELAAAHRSEVARLEAEIAELRAAIQG